MPQLEGPRTKIYNYVLGVFGEKKKIRERKKEKDWQQLVAQVPTFGKRKKRQGLPTTAPPGPKLDKMHIASLPLESLYFYPCSSFSRAKYDGIHDMDGTFH